MQTLCKIILIARNNGWITANPFINYKIRLKKVDRGQLTEEELQRILQKKMPCVRLEQMRDIFIFSCYTGSAFANVRQLIEEHLITDIHGMKWIRKPRQKTGNMCNIPLLDI